MSTACVDLRREADSATGVRSKQDSNSLGFPEVVEDCSSNDAIFEQLDAGGPENTTGTSATDGGGSSPDFLMRVAKRLSETDSRLAREVYLEALSLEILKGRGCNIGIVAVCQAAHSVLPPMGEPQPTDIAVSGLIRRFTVGYADALSELRAALDAFIVWEATDRGRWDRLMTRIAMEIWDDRPWQNVATSLELARSNGQVACVDHAALLTALRWSASHSAGLQ